MSLKSADCKWVSLLSVRAARSMFCLTTLILVYAFPVYEFELYRSYQPASNRSVLESIHDAFYVETVEATTYSLSYGIDLLVFTLLGLGTLATSYILLSGANSVISKFNIKPQDWPYLGASLALKFLIAFTLINGPSVFSGWPEFPGTYGFPFVLSALITGLWAVYDHRPTSLLRLAVLSGLAYLILSFDAELEVRTSWLNSTVREWHPHVAGELSPDELIYRSAPFLFTKLIIEIGFIGFLVGWIHSIGLNKLPVRISLSRIIGVTPRSLLFGGRLSLPQICVGALIAILLVGLVTAQNTAIFRGTIIWPTRSDCEVSSSCLFNHLASIPRQFDSLAIAHAAIGGISALPFILLGSLVLYCLSRRNLVGIFPVLGIGALLGYLWSFSVPETVWTTHLSWRSLCTFIAMIIAAASSAAAHSAPAQIRVKATPPKSRPVS